MYAIHNHAFLRFSQCVLGDPRMQYSKLCIPDYARFAISLYLLFHPKTETFRAFRFQSIVKHLVKFI